MKKIREYFIYFILYSIIGWCYEVFLEVVVYRWGFSNRGVLFGPYCPVYGFGALAFIFTIYPLIKNRKGWKKYLMIPVVFLLCMTVATIIELLTSYLCEWSIGSWPWNYSNYKYNFEGRIGLSPSIRFGIGGLVFLYVLQPLFQKMYNSLGEKKQNYISTFLGVIILIDVIYTLVF